MKKSILFLVICFSLAGCSPNPNQADLLQAIYDHNEDALNQQLNAAKLHHSTHLKALAYAARYGNAEIANLLLQNGGEKLLQTKGGIRNLTPIQEAVIYNNIPVYQKFIKKDPDHQYLTTLDNKGRSLLHLAMGAGAIKMAEELLADGLDPNLQDDAGNTPMMTLLKALQKNRSELKKFQIYQLFKSFQDYGMNPDIVNQQNESVRSIVEGAKTVFIGSDDSDKRTLLDQSSLDLKLLLRK
ncbi:ankyrin repeat domain-containing protein [Neobacillus cucumis]|uniref:Uncharacterized protein n=1 Tax=Neobacillus cucumis TaxID=1740721 RepID=A0A2N5HA02_9BACI|nr:ankyrin repeat domain-containing protein [Neobacillus cucumis]PLS02334.1 hypothetical protein CVD27_20350 [Neobacillus cucumis]